MQLEQQALQLGQAGQWLGVEDVHVTVCDIRELCHQEAEGREACHCSDACRQPGQQQQQQTPMSQSCAWPPKLCG